MSDEIKEYVCDLEGDSLTPTKLYCLSYSKQPFNEVKTITSYEKMKKFFLQENAVFIFHNGKRFDIPVVERLLKIKVKNKVVDSLFLSWYLYPTRKLHGLEAWGEYYGVEKPPIEDWVNLSLKEYCRRCEEDVKINVRLWIDQRKLLRKIYDEEEKEPYDFPLVNYLMFKADCAVDQEKIGWKVDVEKVKTNISILEAELEVKTKELVAVMPKVNKYANRTPPAKPFKKNGSLSSTGVAWKALTEERGLPFNHNEIIKVVVGQEEPNPGSSDQVKTWLYSLGWEPITFKEVKEDDGSIRKVAQVKKPFVNELCDSIVELIDEHPQVAFLQGYSILCHRLTILNGFLRDKNEEDILQAKIQGLTNTLRFKHTVIVNLPKVEAAYGQYIRECLITREGCLLCGSDMAAIEDKTKRHYMFEYDPDFVNEMSIPGFDPHLDLAVTAGVLTFDQMEAHKKGEENHKVVRGQYKVVNYSATYGIGVPKLSRDLKCTTAKAKELLDIYWKRNWAIRKIAEACPVKFVDGQKWLFNKVSGFWYSLRAEKDRFSTLNQSTGVYCFDKWLARCRKNGVVALAQFHDEQCIEFKNGEEDVIRSKLLQAIKEVNDELKLNVQLEVSIKVGKTYADVH